MRGCCTVVEGVPLGASTTCSATQNQTASAEQTNLREDLATHQAEILLRQLLLLLLLLLLRRRRWRAARRIRRRSLGIAAVAQRRQLVATRLRLRLIRSWRQRLVADTRHELRLLRLLLVLLMMIVGNEGIHARSRSSSACSGSGMRAGRRASSARDERRIAWRHHTGTGSGSGSGSGSSSGAEAGCSRRAGRR